MNICSLYFIHGFGYLSSCEIAVVYHKYTGSLQQILIQTDVESGFLLFLTFLDYYYEIYPTVSQVHMHTGLSGIGLDVCKFHDKPSQSYYQRIYNFACPPL